MSSSQPFGYVVYEGPSQFDPSIPIIIIMTMTSRNDKTDNMVQTWILLQNVPPHEAVKQNLDKPICGDCIHRLQRTCYVETYRAPLNVYKAWIRGIYPLAPTDLQPLLGHRELRIGSYGDPAAAPLPVWIRLAEAAKDYTGYTHFWRTNPGLAAYCMASVETLQERAYAKRLGFRTFRPRKKGTERAPGEAQCPATKEAGNKLKCLSCMYCNARAGVTKGDVSLELHGVRGHLLEVAE